MSTITDWKWVIIVAFVLAVVGQIVHTIGAALAMSYYTDPQYFPVWSKLMMPGTGKPPASFILASLIVGVISSFIFAFNYSIVKGSIPGDTQVKKGLAYGLLFFLVVGVTFLLTVALLINLPLGLLISWAFESLVINLVGGQLAVRFIS